MITAINPAFFMGKWLSCPSSKLLIINIDKTEKTNKCTILSGFQPFQKSKFWNFITRYGTDDHNKKCPQHGGQVVSDKHDNLNSDADERFIICGTKQFIEFRCIAHFNFNHPSFFVRIFIDRFRRRFKILIEGKNFS